FVSTVAATVVKWSYIYARNVKSSHDYPVENSQRRREGARFTSRYSRTTCTFLEVHRLPARKHFTKAVSVETVNALSALQIQPVPAGCLRRCARTTHS